ncbi:MAG: hypothetical protein AAFX93_09205 [Verrucomicrobiota bacterium]
MQTGALPLTLAHGWKKVPPRATGRRLVWQKDGQWWASDTDFAAPLKLGPVGPLECPLAVNAARDCAYRYHCADWSDRRDTSEIRSVSLVDGKAETLFRLGLNKWAIWLCHYLPKRDYLVGLIATEMPRRADGSVVIQHQLGLFDLNKRRSLLVALPRDCFYPLDVNLQQEWVLFHGVEGFQVVDFKGRRLWRWGPKGLPEGRGGMFHPEHSELAALGGGGIVLIDRQGKLQPVHDRGLNPVWHPAGKQLYFAESSSDLWRWDSETTHTERLLAVAGNRYSEVNRARSPRLTKDGRYAAVTLTRRVRREALPESVGPNTGPSWVEWRAICIIDLVEQEVWQAPGGGLVAWVE